MAATLSTSELSTRPENLRRQNGSTLVEVMLGTAIASLGIAGLCVANAQCLRIARAHREMLTANYCVTQRADQFRAANWTQITDPVGVSGLLTVAAVNDDSLGNHAETVTVSAYPAVSPAVAPISVTRDATGATTVNSQPPTGFSLRNTTAVQINFQESWSSNNGRPRSRESTTVIAYGGLLPH